ncbi:translation initiation factor Sui1 [Saccharospirillum sp.]|uniref:translation initiation factor Sui1 n=1 Tax=Saccharospirillum sp. TaxID=2033801 RepID=UPI0034A04FC1
MALVYSTESGRTCPDCQQPRNQCQCNAQDAIPEGDGIVRISRETKGRKGKGVTLIRGISLAEKDLKALAKKLKAKCGTGGTVKDGVIEIQGDQRDLLVTELSQQGYTVKRAGG